MVKLVVDKPALVIDEALGIGQMNWDAPEYLALGQTQMHKVFRTLALEPGSKSYGLPRAQYHLDINVLPFKDPLMPDRILDGEQLLNRRIFNDGLIVVHRDRVVHESYRNGMKAEDRHVIHSCTKSLCAMLVAIAIDEGLLDSDSPISDYIPQFKGRTEWQGVSLQHVLDMQAGIFYSEDYSDPNAHYWAYARAAGYYPPEDGEEVVGAKAWIYDNLNTRHCPPGSQFVYNSCLANVLGIALENVYQEDLADIFESRLFQKVGAESSAYFNTDAFGFPITEGQLNLCLQDFARVAWLMLDDGKNLGGQQILPKDFVQQTISPCKAAQDVYQKNEVDAVFPSGQYRNQFWVLEPEAQCFTMLGIHGQFAWYDLKRKVMIVGNGSFPQQDGELMMRSLKTLWHGVASALDGSDDNE